HQVVEGGGALGVDPHRAHPVGHLGQHRIAAGGSPAPSRRQRRGVDGGEGGHVGQVLDLLGPRAGRDSADGRAVGNVVVHAPHLPTMFWPHTRSVSPRRPPASSEARKAIVSATSTGRPPCCREFTRRATSRFSGGIRSVISVSMKPGATALAVPPRGASCSASAPTKAITPALEAA